MSDVWYSNAMLACAEEEAELWDGSTRPWLYRKPRVSYSLLEQKRAELRAKKVGSFIEVDPDTLPSRPSFWRKVFG